MDMCEIDVSEILNRDCGLLSASRWELGDNAAKITWRNCLALAEEHPIIDDSNRDAARDHFAEYGAWERDEIDGWSDVELSAMVWQESAACFREFEDHCDADIATYEEAANAGRVSGRLSLTGEGSEVTRAFIYLGT